MLGKRWQWPKWLGGGEKARKALRDITRWLVVVFWVVLLLFGCGQLGLLWRAPAAGTDTRSELMADYSPWPYTIVQAVDPRIIEEIRRDWDRYPDTYRDAPTTILVPGTFWLMPAATRRPTAQPSPSLTAAATSSPPATPSPTSSSPPTATATLTFAPTRTATPFRTASPTLTATFTPSRTPTPTNTAPPAATSTATATRTNTPTFTFTPSPTPTATATFTNTPTASTTPTPSNTSTASPTPTPSATQTSTSTPTSTATASCSGDTLPGGFNVGPPDGSVFNIPCGQAIVIDLGSTPIVTHQGYDLVYYEGPLNATQIAMDWVIVEVCTDAACGQRYQVFNWFDGVLDANTSVGAMGYSPGEPDNQPIPMADLYGPLSNQTGIAIDVDAPGMAPPGTYRYVRLYSPPGGDNDASQVDALQVIPASTRVAYDVQALYTFEEGAGSVVNDVSGVGAPLNLTIADSSSVSWVAGGLSVNAPTIVSSNGPASKIISACTGTNQITVEAWVRPANTTQTGPARMVTLSGDATNRNAHLAQSATAYNARLRTSDPGVTNNGTPELDTPPGAASTGLTHVVFTRNAAGQFRLYVNNVVVLSGTRPGTFSNWNSGYGLALANEFTMDGPWRGEFHLVAVYRRALTPAEVSVNFYAGAN